MSLYGDRQRGRFHCCKICRNGRGKIGRGSVFSVIMLSMYNKLHFKYDDLHPTKLLWSSELNKIRITGSDPISMACLRNISSYCCSKNGIVNSRVSQTLRACLALNRNRLLGDRWWEMCPVGRGASVRKLAVTDGRRMPGLAWRPSGEGMIKIT